MGNNEFLFALVNYDHQLRRALVTGISGSGKTSLGIHLLQNWGARWVFCFDPDRQISTKTGWSVATTNDEVVRLASQFRPVCYDPLRTHGSDLVAGLESFAGLVLRLSRKVNGVKVIGVDEVWKCTEKKLGPNLRSIFHEGRIQEIDSVILTQQLNETPPVIRSQCSQLWTFLQDDRLALDWLHNRGFEREEIQNLKYPGGYILKDGRQFIRGTTTRAGIPQHTHHENKEAHQRTGGSDEPLQHRHKTGHP